MNCPDKTRINISLTLLSNSGEHCELCRSILPHSATHFNIQGLSETLNIHSGTESINGYMWALIYSNLNFYSQYVIIGKGGIIPALIKVLIAGIVIQV